MAVAPFRIETFDSQLDDTLERICESLQITPTMYAQAETRYHAIGDWLAAESSPLSRFRPQIYSQGSVRIGTTVRPMRYQEHDVDLVCQFDGIAPSQVPRPVLLLDAIEKRLREHQTYRHMLERKNRCIRVVYENEFHLDVLPACPDEEAAKKAVGCLLVPDRKVQDWKASNPEGYAHWFLNRCELLNTRGVVAKDAAAAPLPKQEASAEKAPLKRAVQLLKRARDIHFKGREEFAPVSVVLTTLAARAYDGESTVHDSFGALVSRIVDAIHHNMGSGHRLKVLNPMNPDEDFSEKWNDPRLYFAFVQFIGWVQDTWTAIHDGMGTPKLTELLGKLFGPEVTRAVVLDQAKLIRVERDAGQLGIMRGSGVITSASAAAIPMRANTFFGDADV